MADDKDKTPDSDDRIALERAAADAEHAAKMTGDIPPRRAADAPEAPRHRRKGRHGVAVQAEVPSTGHEWDGITEYDNPMPRWWLWTFYATIIWSIGYVIAYPAIPLVNQATQGLLGTNTRQQVAAEIQRFDQANAAVQTRLASVELDQIPGDAELMNYATNAGGAVFRTWCAQCHGSGAGGARGYPNLLDNAWLWGGTLEDIHLTLQHGIRDPQDPDTRYSEMPAFGRDELLEGTQIDQVVEYVLSLSELPHDQTAAAAGEVVFQDNCAACHMEDGTGDRMQGAPNLADAVWLYGSDPQTIRRMVQEGPYGVMPAWSSRLSEADIRAVAAYVHGLGGGE
ncbi:MAG: cytochrome-c oxidase, cbb3-type subunit III [Paracoccus sp.]|nr:MAG: cytochrome-c oxidase, cbb3-type subunit III [Paracoccus sp. (in: a-proteobacteria)]